jgi:signal transduction histidine kinase
MDRFYQWLKSLPGVTDPDDLRLDTLKEIAPILYIVSGVALFRSFRLSGHQLIASLIVGLLLLVAVSGAQRMKGYNFRVAWSWLILWILFAISFEAWGFPETPARFYFPIAIFAASLLTYAGNVIIVSTLSVIAVGFIALAQGNTLADPDSVLYPTLLIVLLGTITFITSHHLHEEVQRSRFSSGRVRDMLEQLRLQRVELDKTIKTSELANKRIETMNAELVVARNAAENADRIKSEFLAHMSHELRTPLNAILNFTAFVADGLMGDVNDEQIDTLQKVMDSGNHLLSLINDILDISKIEAGMMNLFIEDVDLNTILKGTVSTSKGLLKNKPVELVAEIDENLPMISGDKRRIRQIFLNLVSNAVKFTPKGTISLKACQRNGEIYIEVKDSGVGIASEEQPIVFEAFKQAQHDLETTPGTGLGLPICKHFIEAHGGRIWLESEKGKGTTFFVTLPLVAEGLDERKTKDAETDGLLFEEKELEDREIEQNEQVLIKINQQELPIPNAELEVTETVNAEPISSAAEDTELEIPEIVQELEKLENVEEAPLLDTEETEPRLPKVEAPIIFPQIIKDESQLDSVFGGNGHSPETDKVKQKLSRIVL